MTAAHHHRQGVSAGRHQLPADQPHPAPPADAVHGLVQQDRAAAGARRLDRAVAAVLGSRPERGQEDHSSPACTTASPASSRRARGRSITIPTSSSARATPSSAPAGGSPAPSSSRSKAFPTRSKTCSATPELVERHRNGIYVTLRLTSSMYHRFHAPHDCRVERVTYISGDTWNVNPIALEAGREAVLQERARGDRDPAGSERRPRHAGAGRRHPGGQHPAALPETAADLRNRGRQRRSLAPPPIAKATRWDGSSTARPSSCWRRGRCHWRTNVHTGTVIRQGQAVVALAG